MQYVKIHSEKKNKNLCKVNTSQIYDKTKLPFLQVGFVKWTRYIFLQQLSYIPLHSYPGLISIARPGCSSCRGAATFHGWLWWSCIVSISVHTMWHCSASSSFCCYCCMAKHARNHPLKNCSIFYHASKFIDWHVFSPLFYLKGRLWAQTHILHFVRLSRSWK